MADRYDANLDAFWDSRNGQPGRVPVLDAELAATIEQLHTLYASSPPSSTRERVRQRVLDQSSSHQENASTMNALALPAPTPARPSPKERQTPKIDRRSLWIAIAAAAVILFASFGGWFAYEQRGGPSHPAVIPAAQESTPTTETQDWPIYRGNPGRTGAMPGTGPKTTPGVVWNALLDGAAYRSPIVVGDTAYVGTATGTLYALDAATGEQRWTFTGDASLEITPAYLDGVVYIPSQVGTLYAVDAATGTQLWQFAEPLAEFATPTFGDGLLFAGSETTNRLYGIDPKTGAEVWHFDTASQITRGQAYVDGILYSGSELGVLYALNATDGALVWQHEGAAHGTPSVGGGVVYTTNADGQLLMLDASNGDEIGTIESTSADGITPPTIGDSLFYVGTHSGAVDALDPATQQVIWSYPTQQTIQAAPALVDGVLYAVGLDSTIFALDATTGAELWTYQANGAMDFGPTIAHGMVYVSTEAGEVFALGEGGTVVATPAAGEGASPAASPAAETTTGFDQSQLTVAMQITGSDEHPLAAPQGIAIAPNGNVYFVNAVTDTVEIYSPEGEWLESLGGTGSGPGQFSFHTPGDDTGLGDLAFDADGNLYVFDTLNDRVQKFGPDNTFLLEWGSKGSGNGQFDEVTGSVDPRTGRVYATDLGNRVQVFDLNGTFLDKWGSTGSGPGKYKKPTDVVVDSLGNIYVGEEGGHRVQKFDAYGTLLASTGINGTMEGEYGEVFALAIDADDNLYIASFTTDEITILDANGKRIGVIDSIPGLGFIDGPIGMTIGPDGALWIVEESNSRIVKLQLPPLEG